MVQELLTFMRIWGHLPGISGVRSCMCIFCGTVTIPEHPSSPPVLSVVRVALIVDFCVMFGRYIYVLLHLAIVLPVLRFTDYDDPFGIF